MKLHIKIYAQGQQQLITKHTHVHTEYLKDKKVKAVCGSYNTAALRHIVPLPK